MMHPIEGSIAILSFAISFTVFCIFDAAPFLYRKLIKRKPKKATKNEIYYNFRTLSDSASIILGDMALNDFFEAENGIVPKGLFLYLDGRLQYHFDNLVALEILNKIFNDETSTSQSDRYTVSKIILSNISESKDEVIRMLHLKSESTKDKRTQKQLREMIQFFNQQASNAGS